MPFRPSTLPRVCRPSLRPAPPPRRPVSSTASLRADSDPDAALPAAPQLSAAATTFERVARAKAVDESNPAFGTSFTDHMLSIPWTADSGWSTPSIHPVRPLSLHPATSSLQYAFQCFEGLKAYRATSDGTVRLFRPELNMARLNRAAARLCLPTFDPASGVEVLKAFVRAEERFVPAKRGHALYLRPTLISTEPSIAMFAPRSALLYALASPMSTFYRAGSSAAQPAITLAAAPDCVRAFPAGTGAHKIGANYAPCFLPQARAARAGHAQNLWVLPTGADHLLQEVGTMNLFVLLEERGSGRLELATPPLASRTILPGVTRASVLDLARRRLDPQRYVVRERDVGMRELVGAAREGRLREIFGSGTAVVVAPVSAVEWQGAMVECAVAGGDGSLADTVKGWLEAIQFGEEESEWSVRVT